MRAYIAAPYPSTIAMENTTILFDYGEFSEQWNFTKNFSILTTSAPVPRKYNWPALCLFSIVLVAFIGNIMVCLAVKLEKKLHNMFNYFLVSLACSDMLSATLIMPLSITRTFIGE